jgi:hypothetical protein
VVKADGLTPIEVATAVALAIGPEFGHLPSA